MSLRSASALRPLLADSQRAPVSPYSHWQHNRPAATSVVALVLSLRIFFVFHFMVHFLLFLSTFKLILHTLRTYSFLCYTAVLAQCRRAATNSQEAQLRHSSRNSGTDLAKGAILAVISWPVTGALVGLDRSRLGLVLIWPALACTCLPRTGSNLLQSMDCRGCNRRKKIPETKVPSFLLSLSRQLWFSAHGKLFPSVSGDY